MKNQLPDYVPPTQGETAATGIVILSAILLVIYFVSQVI